MAEMGALAAVARVKISNTGAGVPARLAAESGNLGAAGAGFADKAAGDARRTEVKRNAND
jgi:hypothetical protein